MIELTAGDQQELAANRAGIWRLFVIGRTPMGLKGVVIVKAGDVVHVQNGRLDFGRGHQLWASIDLYASQDIALVPTDAPTFDARYVQTGKLKVWRAWLTEQPRESHVTMAPNGTR